MLATVFTAAIVLEQKPHDVAQAPTPAVVVPAPAPPSQSPSPPPACSPQLLPTSAIDEPIAAIAAASDAPVIVVASARHAWISRDDGKTFTRALDSDGAISSLFVEPDGRVYVFRSEWGNYGPVEALGIADPDGHEHWREPPRGSLPVAARGGWIVGMAKEDGMLVGWDAGNRWERIPATHGWNPWRMTMGANRVSYYLAMRGSEDDHSMHLLAASEAGRARSLWRLPSADTVGGPDAVVPCAAFAGDTLHIVVRGTTPGSSRLLSIGPDGHRRERVLVGQMLDDRELTCDLAGNERATFLTLHTYRTMYRVTRIDTDEPRNVAEYSFSFRHIAGDAHGNLLFHSGGCLQRLSQAGRQTQLACGPDHHG